MYTKEASFSLKEILYFIYMRDDTRCPLTVNFLGIYLHYSHMGAVGFYTKELAE